MVLVFIVEFHTLMSSDIYSGDVATIFGRLKIPIKFIDVNGKELTVDGSGSGIYY